MEKSKEPKRDSGLEMFRLCNDYCTILEQADKFPLHELLDKAALSLMAVYKKSFSITRFQTKYENEPQHFLTEKQYNKTCNTLKALLEKKDTYPEIINPNKLASKEIYQASISEDLTDIYQDFYDFVKWYSEGTFESINDSIIELLNNYDKYWGIKLLNVLRAIHVIRYMKKDASLFRDPSGDGEEDGDLGILDGDEEDPDAISEFLNEE
jgi:hypothetical protein